MNDGEEIASVPVTSDDFEYELSAEEPGNYRLQPMRGSAIEGLTNPIRLLPAPSSRTRLRPRPHRFL